MSTARGVNPPIERKILNVGCGRNKPPGHIGIDVNPRTDADIIHDLGEHPWPLADNSFDEVYCWAILEHVPDFYGAMAEIWRVCKDGALVHVSVPHHTDTAAHTDPTHCHFFTTFSFDVITGNTDKWDFYTDVEFELVDLRVKMLSLWRLIPFQALINLSIKHQSLGFFRKLWENYLSYVVRAKNVLVVLRVKKSSEQPTDTS